MQGDIDATVTHRPGSAGPALASTGEADAITLESLEDGAPLAIREKLGEGGMGAVYVASQRAMRRDVAVKQLKDEHRSDRAIGRILREAWTTGALEHPGIVPVHDIVRDSGPAPSIVMKKIDGQPWSALIHDAEAIRERFDARDPLEWNLRVLMQVCNAVHFAHSRGVVHRDLKPENVMIGAFGEVLVLDWGLAVATRDDGTGRFTLSSDVAEIAGTPAYMAPEMLDGTGARLGPHTDVYLLGAILFELATGAPPHAGKRIVEVFAHVLSGDLALPPDLDPVLATTLARALARDPSERVASAEQLRRMLEQILEARATRRLVEGALRTLDRLRAEDARIADQVEAPRAELSRLFGACRFGFEEALRQAPGDPAAREGLASATSVMAERLLSDGDPGAALHLVEALELPPVALLERVRGAHAAHRDAEDRRRALERDHDPRAGGRTRVRISALTGMTWTALPLVGFGLERFAEAPDQLAPLVSSILSLAVGTALAYRYRSALSASVLNRALVRTVGVVLAAQIALFAATWALGVTYEHTRPLVLLLYAACCAITSSAIEPRLAPSTLAYAAVAVVAVVWPTWSWPLEAIANGVLTLNVVSIWRQPPRRTGGPTDPDNHAH